MPLKAEEAAGKGAVAVNDRELLYQLLEDSRIVGNIVLPGARPTPQAARAVIAPILRRWICEGLFYSVQKLVHPHIIHFPIRETPLAVEKCKSGILEHWMAMVEIDGIGLESGLLSPSFRGKPFPVELQADQAERHERPAKDFFSQPMFFWRKRFFTRREVLGLYANRHGGVHLDFRRSDDEGHVDELRGAFGVEIVDGNHQLLVGKSVTDNKMDPVRRHRTYDALELVAIDTANIFAKGLRSSEQQLTSLLQGA